MSDALISEQIREMLPDLAAPIRPGEGVALWLDRAARACGVPAARLRQYWHRKVEAPRASEYLKILGAAEAASRRQRAIQALEAEIAETIQRMASDRAELEALSPALARYAPQASPDPTSSPAQSGLKKPA